VKTNVVSNDNDPVCIRHASYVSMTRPEKTKAPASRLVRGLCAARAVPTAGDRFDCR
jgi:hypothetical protein